MKSSQIVLLNFFKQLIKFSLVGLLNTLITLSTIFILINVLNLNYIISNIIGYVLGFTNSFILNKKWTFKSKGSAKIEIILFFILFIICYLLQLISLILLKELIKVSVEKAQLIAMIIYTTINFLGSKYFVYTKA